MERRGKPKEIRKGDEQGREASGGGDTFPQQGGGGRLRSRREI